MWSHLAPKPYYGCVTHLVSYYKLKPTVHRTGGCGRHRDRPSIKLRDMQNNFVQELSLIMLQRLACVHLPVQPVTHLVIGI